MGLREVTVEDERALQEIADALARSHKILLVTGAGISTSCGIPVREPAALFIPDTDCLKDFRSKDGLYNMIPSQNMLPTPPSSQPSTPTHNRVLDLASDNVPSSQQSRSRRSSASPSSRLRGQDLFDSRVFQNAESTTVFYRFIASMRQKIHDEVRATSSVHKFVRVLRDGGRLMRCYTQNIDGLEAREGLVTDLRRGKGNKRRFMKKHYEVPRPAHTENTDFDGGCEVVQLHGDLDKLRCTMCSTQYEWREDETEIYLEGAAPSCPKCKEKSLVRQATGKRGLATGSLRPNIVLYGEDHPSNTLLTPLIPFDASCQPEVLVIMGTSLKVFGLQKIVREFAKSVHSQKNGKGRVLFVNRTRPSESMWEGIIDDFVAMDCDNWVEDLKNRRHDLWLRQGEIDLSSTKSAQPKRKRKLAEVEVLKDNKSRKKAKIVVETPSPRPETQSNSTGTLSRRVLTPKRIKLPQNYPGRAILSPLAQAQRPPVSPFTSPIRGEDGTNLLSPRKPGTPMRPPMSPFSSPIYSNSERKNWSPRKRGTEEVLLPLPSTPRRHPSSKLKMQIFQDSMLDTVLQSSPAIDDREVGLASSEREEDDDQSHTIQPRSKLWQRVKSGRFFGFGRATRSSRDLYDEAVEISTPSRGPKGRQIDVLARGT